MCGGLEKNNSMKVIEKTKKKPVSALTNTYILGGHFLCINSEFQ